MSFDGITTSVAVHAAHKFSTTKSHRALAGADVFLNLPTAPRQPTHIVCLIDVSGSMASVASGGTDKALESSAFSCLDLAKHSMSTLIAALQPTDALTVFSFESTPHKIFDTQLMTDDAKTAANAAVAALVADGGTSIWQALRAAVDTVSEYNKAAHPHSTSIFLLTDGQECGAKPEGGTVAGFRAAAAEAGVASLTLHTLGYGYEVESKLLEALAAAGVGAYGFIPDATMVGTVFVNFVSTVLSTACSHVRVSLEGPAGAEFAGAEPGTTTFDAGLLLYGQQRSVHVLAPAGWQGRVVFCAMLPNGDMKPLATQAVDLAVDAAAAEPSASATYARELVAAAVQAWSSRTEAGLCYVEQKELAAAVRAMAAVARPEEAEYFAALMSDLTGDTEATGQIGKAIDEKHLRRWGRHYLAGLGRCHRMQIQQNFKDAALQGYGGALFTETQLAVEQLFCMLPPPTATGAPGRGHGGGGRQSPSWTAPASMVSYYNRSGGCFHGPCVVQLAGGVRKAIADLVRGDRVLCSDGVYRRVDCVVTSPQQAQGRDATGAATIGLYDVGGVLLTAYHPVHVGGRWAFPVDCGAARMVTASAVFNVLLERGGQDMLVWAPAHMSDSAAMLDLAAAVRCITLAHGIATDAVATHAYLGAPIVREHLERMRGWASGLIVLDESKTVRNPATNLVERWVEETESDTGLALHGCVVSHGVLIAAAV